jgi:putative transposase
VPGDDVGWEAVTGVVLAAAYVAHPERFVNGPPRPADLPTAVWINPPVKKPARQDAAVMRCIA